MRKPDDISQYVWDAAEAIKVLPEFKFAAWRYVLSTDIARAIIAAKAEEREAAIAAVIAVPDQIPCVVRVPAREDLTSGGTPFIEPAHDRHTTRSAKRDDFVAAIRKRGEPTP